MLKVEIPNSKDKIVKQIAALEYIIKQDTISKNMKDLQIHSQVLKDLQEQLLYISYIALQSEEFKEDIIGCYESFNQSGADVCIKISFSWGWLRVYRTSNGQIEWY